MKKAVLSLVLALFFFAFTAQAQNAFITTWKTTAANESITIPINPNVSGYNYTVNWGDGNTSTGQTGNATHTYTNAGTHTVSITGDFPAIQFGSNVSDGANDAKLLTVEQWGSQVWQSMVSAFQGCKNLTRVSTTDNPQFVDGISLASMFKGAVAFNGDISTWNVSNVTDMSHMFEYVSVFNQNLSNWNTTKVINLQAMFKGVTAFNGNISTWDVSNVTDMSRMFENASAFDQDISTWDVSNVTNMSFMFLNVSAFNQDIGNWNVSKVIDMSHVLENAISFNQNIGNWNISNVSVMTNMLNNSGLSTANYDSTLIGWAAQQNIPSGLALGAQGLTYCAADSARQALIDNHGWTINGDTKDPNCGGMQIFIAIPNQDTLLLNVYSSDAVQQVKQKIEDSTGIESAQQQLYFLNQKLDDGRTLADYNIQYGDTLDLAIIGIIHPDANGILYVNINVTGGNQTGNSWANAIPELADALKWANLNEDPSWTTTPLKIFVAIGTYKPLYSPEDGANLGTDQGRDNAFLVVNNVQLYGGFDPANGIDDLTDARILPSSGGTGGSILSGDFNGDDVVTGSGSTLSITGNTENAYHVVVSADSVGSALLDGFTFSGGNADGVETITVNSVTVTRNEAGGIFNVYSSPTLTNLIITSNSADYGGGMNNDNSSSKVTNVSISGNYSIINGGGMYNDNASPKLVNVSIVGNSASGDGGGMFNINSSPVLVNVTLAGNSTSGIYNTGPSTNPQLYNTVVWNSIQNDMVLGGSYTAQYSLILGSSDTTNGNIDATGLTAADIFNDPANGNYSLKTSSPAVNAGSNPLYEAADGDTNNNSLAGDVDLAGNLRLNGPTIDMGAYEFQGAAGMLCPPAGDSILYVDSAAVSGGNGLSWTTAFNKLQDALDLADSCDQVKQIWVAKGTYKPTKIAGDGTGNRDKSFVLIPDVKIYGGFAGNEPVDYDLSQRNFKENETILSGDIGTPRDRSDNCNHVVISVGNVGSALLDGFTITGGNASAGSGSNSEGGGMYLQNSSPMLTNIVFSDNKAGFRGGGMHNEGGSSPILTHIIFSNNEASVGGGMSNSESSPRLTNVTFSDNQAGSEGGGMANHGSSPVLIQVTFNGNESAATGGGMYNAGGSPTLTNVLFSGNLAGSVIGGPGGAGGGMFNQRSSPVLTNVSFRGNQTGTGGGGGGMYNQGGSPRLINLIFSGNSAAYGGGMYNISSSPRLMNVSLTGNSADSVGGGMFNRTESAPTLTNVILWNNEAKDQTGAVSASIYNSSSSPRISYSLIANSGGSGAWNDSLGTDGGHNIDTDPQFLEPVNPDDAPTTAGILRLANTSPAINRGDPNTDLTIFSTDENGDPADLDYNPRVFNEENGGIIDMGAYEYQGTVGMLCPPAGDSILYVDSAAANGGGGLSWATAFNKLQDALDLAAKCTVVKQIWVAKGTYKPTKKIVEGAPGLPATDRNMAFVLVPDVKIYGGFAGNETSLDDRNWETNKTILSGDIGTEGDSSDNTYHVVVSAGEVGSALLDGFLITGGNANGFPVSSPIIGHDGYYIARMEGGGISTIGSSPTFSNIIISENAADLWGAGVFNYMGYGNEEAPTPNSSPTFKNTVISNNTAEKSGGGVVNFNSSPVFTNTLIRDNRAVEGAGGGMLNFYLSQPIIMNTLIMGNQAKVGGAVANATSGGMPTFVNVTILKNQADSLTGGMYTDSVSTVKIYNSIIWSNTTSENDKGNLYTGSTSTTQVSYSIIQGGYEGNHVINANPRFTDIAHGNYSLTLCSPAINTGSNQLYTNNGGDLQKDKDLNNDPRLFGKNIDMGAYEFQDKPAPPTIISAQPADTTVCGQEASFSISATGYQLSYQWQSSTDGTNWNNETNGTAEILGLSNIKPSDNGMQYRVILTSGCQKKDTSAIATLMVNKAPAITRQPQDTTVDWKGTAQFEVTATGSATAYQWQSSTDGTSWNNVTNGTSETLELSNLKLADSGTLYRVIVSNDCAAFTSQPATLHVNPPVLILQPTTLNNGFAGVGYSVTFEAHGGTAPYAYVITSGNIPPDLSFSSSNGILSGTPSTAGSYTFTVKATGSAIDRGAPFSVSKQYTLKILNAGSCISVSGWPADQTICEGEDAAFSVTGTGITTYQWQAKGVKSNTWQDIAGANEATLNVNNTTVAQSGMQYRVILGSNDCGSLTSASATLSVRENAAITTQPTNQTVGENGDASFSITATGANLTYQWQSSADGTNWDNIANETSSTLNLVNVTLNDNGTRYRVIVNSDCGTVTSDVALLSVQQSTAIITQPTDRTVCENSNASFSVNATGTSLIYQWQSSSNDTTWNDITGEKSSTLNLSDVQLSDNNKKYRVVVSGLYGTVTSASATLGVRENAAITMQPTDMTVCENGETGFSVKASGTDLKYQWQGSTDGNNWNNITGETAETLELSNVGTDQNGTQYRVMVSSACGNVTSDAVRLTVDPIKHTTLNETICEGQSYTIGTNKYTTTGTYQDTLRSYTGCDSVVVLHLQVNAQTVIETQPANKTICEDGKVTFSVNATGTNISYQWQSSTDGTTWNNVTNGTTATLELSNIETTQSGTQYRVIVRSDCGDVTSGSATLTVHPLPTLTIVADSANPVSKGWPVHLTAGGAQQYKWTNGPGIQSGWNEATLTIRPQADATYTVTGTTAEGCTATQSYAVKIVVDYKLICNNIVSPNGDGKNDKWIIQNIGSYPDNEVMIYDRAGRMIYHKKRYNNQWNGKVVGRPLVEGTYYYVFLVDGGKKIFKGYIELLNSRHR